MGRWIQCIIEAILPSMSLLHCNANISFELWGLLKHMPYQIRFEQYNIAVVNNMIGSSQKNLIVNTKIIISCMNLVDFSVFKF